VTYINHGPTGDYRVPFAHRASLLDHDDLAAVTELIRSGDALSIKMSGHPPFGAQVILNGREPGHVIPVGPRHCQSRTPDGDTPGSGRKGTGR
jgi:hypothetical protein